MKRLFERNAFTTAFVMILAACILKGAFLAPAAGAASPDGAVDMALLPDQVVLNVGETFQATIEVRSYGQEVTGVSAFLDFDCSFIEVVSVTKGATLPIELQNQFDNEQGTIDFSAGTFTPPFPNGIFEAANVTFKAKAPANPSHILFHAEGVRESNVEYYGTSVFGETVPAEVTILGQCAIMANDDEASLDEDSDMEVDILVDDVLCDSSSIAVAIEDSNTRGTVVKDGDGSVT